MPLNLFSDSKYYKYDELYKRYHEELYNYLKERKFILSNEHYLTHWSKQATIAITMFESRCIYDVSETQREEWHEFSIYQIEFRPTLITFKFNEEYNQDDEFNEMDIESLNNYHNIIGSEKAMDIEENNTQIENVRIRKVKNKIKPEKEKLNNFLKKYNIIENKYHIRQIIGPLI